MAAISMGALTCYEMFLIPCFKRDEKIVLSEGDYTTPVDIAKEPAGGGFVQDEN